MNKYQSVPGVPGGVNTYIVFAILANPDINTGSYWLAEMESATFNLTSNHGHRPGAAASTSRCASCGLFTWNITCKFNGNDKAQSSSFISKPPLGTILHDFALP